MNKNVVLIMVGAVFIAITVAMIVQAMLAPSDKPQVTAEGPPTVQVLVASKNLVKGDDLDETDVRWQSWPESALFTGAIVRKDQELIKDMDIMGKIMRRTVQDGEPLMTSMIVSEGSDVNIIAASLSPGKRAVSIPVNASTSVGGFVRPGDMVDIILTYQVRLQGRGSESVAENTVQRYASQTILETVKVLAVDQEFKEQTDPKIAKTVTVEVDQSGAETLALAREMGDLSLALRKFGEENEPTLKLSDSLTTDVLVSDVLKEIAELRERARVKSNVIRVYNGAAVQNFSVRSP